MASNGDMQAAFAPVLQAVTTMRTGDRTQKEAAQKYLSEFQKSMEAWQITTGLLQSEADAEAKVFAATTLKGKITYDTNQLPREALSNLRDQILALLTTYAAGPRPIRIQLCVCLAVLAIQMREWKDVLQVVVSSLGSDAGACILEFLKVLPEEVTQGRKITLTEEELSDRTQELLGDNATQVVQLLTQYAQSSETAATNPLLLECITSWLREVPIGEIVASPLLDIVFKALESDSSFDAAVDCLCKIFKETSDVDECIGAIEVLFPRLLALQPRIAAAASSEDVEMLKGITRLFSEAGESWVVLIAREPVHFRPLVESILECAARDLDREAIGLTFIFWYELKLYLAIDRYMEARVQYVDVYSKLVDIIMRHLEYPTPEDSAATDLFDGDRLLEESFRSFRHDMGDVLKDACEIMGVTQCLTKVLDRLNGWMTTYGSQATATSVPHWQQLEAPLFSMRAMGRMVDREEDSILPQIIPLIVQIPAHEKLRFASIMVLGRYTEWTANHPEFLEPQFNYIVSSFNADSLEIVRAAAMSMKFFCSDCKHLLGPQVDQLQQFYNNTLDSLPMVSQEEMTEGVATVVAVQPPAQTYRLLKLYCDPLMERLMKLANAATDKDSMLAVADHLQLITIFVQWVAPHIESGVEHPGVRYCQEIFPILAQILETFVNFPPICERISRCWRYMFISYRTHMAPLLPEMATKLANAFSTSHQGCFLWVTAAILREFSEDREVDEGTSQAIYAFFESQTTSMLRAMSNLNAAELPDVIEDFFRLLTDALLYYPYKLIPSPLFGPIFDAAINSALTLEQRDPLTATLHYLRDVIGYATDNPPATTGVANPPEIKAIVKTLLLGGGNALVNRVLAGMMITWPRDCYADGSGVILGLFEVIPEETAGWVGSTLALLPPGTMSQEEIQRLMEKIHLRVREGPEGAKNIRSLLQDFTTSYRRRYVAPRDGLGGLEATRFHFP